MGAADLLALLAALLFALAAALQQREAAPVGGEGMSPGFFLELVRRPIWLLGTATLIAGYVVQGAALGKGRLVVIQPLLVTTVVFALPLGIVLAHQVVTRRDWAAAAGVVAGLAAFIVFGQPAAGRDDAPGWEWAASLVAVSGLAAVLVLLGRRARPARRAAFLGGAAGVLFGISASLAKPVVEELGPDGLAAVLGDWRTYAMIATGAAAFYVQQGALATGQLAPAVASTSLANPVVSCIVGILVLEEGLAGGLARKGLAIAALAAAALCAAVLAQHEQTGGHEPAAPAAGRERGARAPARPTTAR
jgi:drug/metabolite transporter (DMT)-like permease